MPLLYPRQNNRSSFHCKDCPSSYRDFDFNQIKENFYLSRPGNVTYNNFEDIFLNQINQISRELQLNIIVHGLVNGRLVLV